MIEYECEYCGKKKYASYPSHTKRFCSHKCANSFRWEHTEKKRIQYICQSCGKPFEVKPGDQRVKKGTVKFCSHACAGEANKSGKNVKCMNCGKEFYSIRCKYCSPKCAREYRVKHNTHKPYLEAGYVTYYRNGYNKKGNAKEHRLIMEDFLGRRLGKDEVVHHINGIKTDNRIENLVVMSRDEHSKLHREMDKAAGKQLFKPLEVRDAVYK